MTGAEPQGEGAKPAVDVLAEAADAARADQVADARTLLRAMLDPEAARELALSPRERVEAYLLVCGAARGLGTIVSNLRGAIRLATPAPGPAPGKGPQDLAAMLRAAGCPEAVELPSLPVPYGYDVSSDGVWRAGDDPVCVARALVAVVGRSVDEASGITRLTVVWPYAGRWRAETVPRLTAVDGRTLLAALADRGCPVDSTTARPLAEWLSAQEQAAGDALPSSRSQGHLGWTLTGDGYALSGRSLGVAVDAVPPGPGEAQAGYGVASGKMAEWVRTVWLPMSGHPGAAAILAAFAAPLLRVVGSVHGFTLELAAASGEGKSTALDAAATVWGPPSHVVQRWPRTKAGARESLTYRTGVPTFWDEAQDVRRTPDLISDALYMAGGEHGQTLGYGGANGGTREARRIETVLISTGEVPSADRCGDAQGALARLVSLRASPIAPGHAELVRSIAGASRTHYGHAGPAFVAYLLKRRDEWPAIAARYSAIVDDLQAKATDDQSKRVAVHVALIHLAAELIVAAGIVAEVPKHLLEAVAAAASANADDRDVPLTALYAAHDWWIARRPQAREAVEHGIRIGWEDARIATGCRIAWLSGALHDALTASGYAPQAVIRQWAKRGWLIMQEGRPTCKLPRAVDESRPRVIAWSAAAMAILDSDPGF